MTHDHDDHDHHHDHDHEHGSELSEMQVRVRALDEAALCGGWPRPLRKRERADSVHAGILAGAPVAVKGGRDREAERTSRRGAGV